MCTAVWFNFDGGGMATNCGDLAEKLGCRVRDLVGAKGYPGSEPNHCLCGIDVVKTAHQNKFVIRPYDHKGDEDIPYCEYVVLPKKKAAN